MSGEKRKFYRMPMEHLAEFREYDLSKSDSELIPSKVKDVSGGGVLFESTIALQVGSLIKVKLNLPGWHKHKTEFIKPDWKSTNEPLVTLGHVARVEELKEGELYEIGIIFTCIDEDHRNALTKYIEDLKAESAA